MTIANSNTTTNACVGCGKQVSEMNMTIHKEIMANVFSLVSVMLFDVDNRRGLTCWDILE
jgi:ornithine cyclodeaminase/alanine dehydrogenase-like protein (mu-crystallin family)